MVLDEEMNYKKRLISEMIYPYKKTKTWIEFTKRHRFIGSDLQRSLTL